jgi:hypothetical protein
VAHAQRPVNYYDILGVAPNATTEEIRAAYRARISQYHPDRNRSTHATAIAALINEVWEVLGNPERRHAYDAATEFSTQRPESAQASPRPTTPLSSTAPDRSPIYSEPQVQKMFPVRVGIFGAIVLFLTVVWVSWMGWVWWSRLILYGVITAVTRQWQTTKRAPAQQRSPWTCPTCGRSLPRYVEQCRCGFVRVVAATGTRIDTAD